MDLVSANALNVLRNIQKHTQNLSYMPDLHIITALAKSESLLKIRESRNNNTTFSYNKYNQYQSQMNKLEIKQLQEHGWNSIRSVVKAIKELTAEKPLILFEKDKPNIDEIYDLPFGYCVDELPISQQGAVMEVCGSEVKLFLTGEDFGEVLKAEIEYVPYECQLQILAYLEERAEA